ncbi:MAG: hypothetical protein IMW91_05485 [Firmicutes bacterium]|nr:hypothetical protein [Bacillota bacterium]
MLLDIFALIVLCWSLIWGQEEGLRSLGFLLATGIALFLADALLPVVTLLLTIQVGALGFGPPSLPVGMGGMAEAVGHAWQLWRAALYEAGDALPPTLGVQRWSVIAAAVSLGIGLLLLLLALQAWLPGRGDQRLGAVRAIGGCAGLLEAMLLLYLLVVLLLAVTGVIHPIWEEGLRNTMLVRFFMWGMTRWLALQLPLLP